MVANHLHDHVDHVSIRQQSQQLAGEAAVPYSFIGCCEVDKHSYGLLFSQKAILNACVNRGLVYGRPPVSKAPLILWEQWVDGWIDTSLNESPENFKRDKHRRFVVPVSSLSLQDVYSNITYVSDLITSLLYDKCLGWTRTPVPRTAIHMHRLFF